MKRSSALAVLAILGFTVLSWALPPCTPPSIEARVLRVIDGDTIEVRIIRAPEGIGVKEETVEQVRYIGINAPESTEPGYEAATHINRLLVEGKTVYLELDVTVRDRYGRLLAYVYLDPEGHFMVNLALATSTLFRAYLFDNTPRYNVCFSQADVDPCICSSCCGECVPAEKASEYYGKEIWVCGVVASVSRLDYNRVFLNFGKPYPNQIFTVMVHERYTSAFDAAYGPRWEAKLLGQVVCVLGTVQEYRGKPEILPTKPEQLRANVLGVPCPPFCPCK